MKLIEFNLYFQRFTEHKAVFIDYTKRIGTVYLPKSFAKRLNISKTMTIQLAADKSILPPGGYSTTCIKNKETPKKFRFNEEDGEEIKAIYITKDTLNGLENADKIALRFIPAPPYIPIATGAYLEGESYCEGYEGRCSQCH